MAEEILDVAIVGGGVSGVYAGWRLATEGRLPRVEVFEASDRIGGRLLSVSPPAIRNMVAELGGMRILPERQPRIRTLIAALNKGAKPADKIVTYPFPVDEDENISYLRGTYLRLADFKTDPARVPYHLTFQELGKVPGQILLFAFEQIVPGITSKDLDDEQRRALARTASFGGRRLNQQGFWQVLMRVISGEAYQLALAAGGYESTLSNWNAADAIPWYLSDFGIDPKYEGFKQGFQQVPLTLAKRFERAGGKIHREARLLGFEHQGKGVELRLAGRKDPIKARRLILAMPRRSLELISDGSPLLRQDSVAALIRSVTPRPLFKLFTTYPSPWWLPAGVKAGRSTTDLPVRQTYYWPKNDGLPATSGPAMLMASYDDGLNIGFWDGFRPKRGQGWRHEALLAAPEAEAEWFRGTEDVADQADQKAAEWRKYRARKPMVAEVQRQLALLHGLAFTPRVASACFKDWGDDPFGGGWNSWNIGVESDVVQQAIVQPAKGVPVYICGEAYSSAQGWVEGALETADLVLAKLGLEPLA
jgi:monoamine oxidase